MPGIRKIVAADLEASREWRNAVQTPPASSYTTGLLRQANMIEALTKEHALARRPRCLLCANIREQVCRTLPVTSRKGRATDRTSERTRAGIQFSVDLLRTFSVGSRSGRIGSRTFLTGWNEIGEYLGKGVRTVQRWEHQGLPVRRSGEGRKATVLALPEELDAWVQNQKLRSGSNVSVDQTIKALRTENANLQRQLKAAHDREAARGRW
jgi:hypothetical protein